jgi:TRAP-type uncharacterized transport system substrate-binding protein
MKKRVYLLISGPLIVSLFFLGFPASARTEVHQEIRVEMLGTKLGTVGQVLCQALVDIVNKNHPWLRLSVTETMGTTDSLKTFANLSPEKKRHTFCLGGDIDYLAARAGRPPFGKAHNDLKFVANMLKLFSWPMTLNEKIKTKTDVPGTRWAVGPRASSIAYEAEFLLWDVWDLKDKVDVRYLSWTAGKDALVARLVDVYFAGCIPLGKPMGAKAKGNPAADELITTQPVRFMELLKEDWDRGKAKRAKAGNPVPWDYLVLKAGAFGKGLPPVDTGGILLINGWYASTETDGEVVYELTKTLLKNYKSFQDYHKATVQMTPEGFADASFITDADVHPAALKAYREFGVKIGF